MHPVGRLDYDTSGLLLFSSSGPLTQALLHPKYEVAKEYVAVVTGAVDTGKLSRQLEEGVTTGAGVHTAKVVVVEHFDPNVVKPYLDTVKSNLPAEYNQTDLAFRGFFNVFQATELSAVRLIVTEGKHRMVRRMLANCGHPVVSLKRERLGMIELGDLPEGSYRDLTSEESAWIETVLPREKLKHHRSNKRKSNKIS
jgi:23S rRNA pseudouridine2605 synthase